MFAKLLKHEFRATRNAMMVLCLTALTMGVAGGGAWWINSASRNTAMKVLGVMVLFLSFLMIAMCGLAAFFLLVARFYKRCFTDEGYLTFTLPVSTHQVLLSTILNAAVNMLIAVVAVIAAYGILGLISCSAIEEFSWITEEMLPEIWTSFWEIMDWKLAGRFALLAFDMIMGCASEFIVIMLSITVGALIAKKHKILAAIGVYYGIHTALSVLGGMTMISALSCITSGVDSFVYIMLYPGVLCTVLAVLGYFLTCWLVSRKLNLP